MMRPDSFFILREILVRPVGHPMFYRIDIEAFDFFAPAHSSSLLSHPCRGLLAHSILNAIQRFVPRAQSDTCLLVLIAPCGRHFQKRQKRTRAAWRMKGEN